MQHCVDLCCTLPSGSHPAPRDHGPAPDGQRARQDAGGDGSRGAKGTKEGMEFLMLGRKNGVVDVRTESIR